MAKRKISKQKGIDVAEVRMRRFFAMLIDWYLGQMIAVIPITFYFRQGEYLQAEMFDLTQYDFGTGLALGIYGLLVGIIYYVVIQAVVSLSGINSNYLKLLSAVIVALFLAVPYWKARYLDRPVSKGGKRHA